MEDPIPVPPKPPGPGHVHVGDSPVREVAEQVIGLRKEKGWTQAQLARGAGVYQADISRLERAIGCPSLCFLKRVASALGARLCVKIEVGEVAAPAEPVSQPSPDDTVPAAR